MINERKTLMDTMKIKWAICSGHAIDLSVDKI